LSFTIRKGECYGLLGPNGAGKTTTLRTLLGLTPFEGGTIEVMGYPIPRWARQARARVGVVAQTDNLDPDFTVEENLLVFGRYFGMRDATIRARVPALLDFAALASKARARINELSGGMKRRLTLARAMINDPDLIIMDEPTTGLDPQARHLIWERLKALLARGKTILLTTHFMDEAERLCHRLGVIDHGRMISEGAPRSLIAEHVEPEVVEVYGDGLHAWLAAHRDQLPARVEVSGETAFCYTQSAAPIVATLQSRDDLRYLHRPANLEDLFLRLTGRAMREEA
jgi:lipooligosaccharide transport system ATP-binding protein